MRGEFVPQHLGGKLESKPDAFAGRQPCHGSAIFHRGLGQQYLLIVGQGFKPPAYFRFQPDGTASASALKRIGGKDVLFHERPVANRQETFSDNSGQLGEQGRSGETEMVTGYGASSLPRELASGFDVIEGDHFKPKLRLRFESDFGVGGDVIRKREKGVVAHPKIIGAAMTSPVFKSCCSIEHVPSIWSPAFISTIFIFELGNLLLF